MATTILATQSPAVLGKRMLPPTRILIALDGSGNGNDVITFSPAFDNAPIVQIVPPLGANGTFTVPSPTTTSVTATVASCSDLASSNVEVVVWGHEKL